MLISPPFLPPRKPKQSESEWLDAAMLTLTSDGDSRRRGGESVGSYPINRLFLWHGGLHLRAPVEDNAPLPVRAIADGTVVYVRKPAEPNEKLDHPLNYGSSPGKLKWTSNGCVLIQHATEIGEGADAQVTFYSLVMHLKAVREDIVAGKPVYRKDELGDAGSIYGEPDRIHFEIFCDDDNLKRFLGREIGNLKTVDSGKDGRTDAVYGEVYVRLPAGAPILSRDPIRYRPELRKAQEAVRKSNADKEKAAAKYNKKNPHKPPRKAQLAPIPQELPNSPRELGRTPIDCVVGIRYEDGAGHFTTYSLDDKKDPWTREVGEDWREIDFEYTMIQRAEEVIKYMKLVNEDDGRPDDPVPCAAAVYELLRFGRVIGPDPLEPETTPHWRRCYLPGGWIGWVDLNAAGTQKHSDADFPQWWGWTLVDEPVGNSHCTSSTIRSWAASESGEVEIAFSARSGPPISTRLSRAICKYPTEWNDDPAAFDKHWDWMMANKERWSEIWSFAKNLHRIGMPKEPMSRTDYEQFKAHALALAFWGWIDKAARPSASAWRFNPKEFVRHFRQCGWLSADELAQFMPRNYRDQQGGVVIIPWKTAQERFCSKEYGPTYVYLNKAWRRFGFITANRQTAFLAQVFPETRALELRKEGGQGHPNPKMPMAQFYGPFHGRGLIQLTWAGNYALYGQFRAFPDNPARTYADSRITKVSLHHWDGAKSRQLPWWPRYDPDIVASDEHAACDSAAWYLVCFLEQYRNNRCLYRFVDQALTEREVGEASYKVNGGYNGYNERQRCAAYIKRYRSDSTETSLAEQIWVTYYNKPNSGHFVSVDYTPQRNNP